MTEIQCKDDTAEKEKDSFFMKLDLDLQRRFRFRCTVYKKVLFLVNLCLAYTKNSYLYTVS